MINSFLNKFKIPTILGLAIILIGLVSGIYLVTREQILLSKAAPDLTPQNITLSNITDSSITISWKTNVSTTSFITYGIDNPAAQTATDDRDTGKPKPHITHYVTLKNLLPKTTYQFKINSGKLISGIQKFDTASPMTNQPEFTPVIGSILDNDNPVTDGIAYLIVNDAATQSSLIKSGNFLIPLSQMRKSDLSDAYQLADKINAKITIITDSGSSDILFNLKANSNPLPPVKLNENTDLTNLPEATPQPTPNIKDLSKYDLNGDGKINVADYAILSTCLNKKISTVLQGGNSCLKADINNDGVINNVDINLMSQRLTELGS